MTQEPARDAEAYSKVVMSFSLGMLRFWRAEAASARMMCALFAVRNTPPTESASDTQSEAVKHLLKIPYSSYDALRYVTDVSHLVYATTLLDTFLSDTTLFLLLRHPRSIGKDHQVSLARLLEAASRSDLVTESAVKKVRDVSYLPFVGRVQFLRDTFGLALTLTKELSSALEHFPSVRNTAVHDQGLFEFALDDQGQIVSRQKACSRHPTPVGNEAVSDAANAYASIAHCIASEVFIHVLHVPDHPSIKTLGVADSKTLPPVEVVRPKDA